jgi:hypothetical protein
MAGASLRLKVKLNLNLRAIAVLWDLSDKFFDEPLYTQRQTREALLNPGKLFIKNE